MWKIPLLSVLQYLESDCNDFDLYDLAKVLEERKNKNELSNE